MSRIHDALRKAAQERAAIAGPELASPPQARVTAPAEQLAVPDVMGATELSARPALARQDSDLPFDHLLTQCMHPKWHPDPNVNVFSNAEPIIHGAEHFRTLRSRLYQLRNNQPLRTILVTSAIPGEGKTFVANNLAQAIVRQSDRRALLIDADLRRPRLHLSLGAPAEPGLADYLGGTADEPSIIQHGQAGNLYFIAGGSRATNPSELLSSGRLKTLLDRVGAEFDWIIVDSPPCVPVADAQILADLCDGVLLVVRAGTTGSEVARRASQEMQARNVVGVVLNAVEENHVHGSYYYYQGANYGYGDNAPKVNR
ncbi:MAG: CpsD/CapB family tyrosine-protein kinase [Acidobacteriia bacterium]|nr:CpsD/CapB family tyrosine-protein kinase [Terriglobia bacterium]